MEKLVLLTILLNAPEAYMMKGLLESEGIESFVFDERAAFYTPLLTGIRIMVRSNDLERAKEIISLQETTPPENG